MKAELDFKEMFSVVSIPLLVIDDSFAVIATNSAYEKLTGILASESIGLCIFDVLLSKSDASLAAYASALRVSLEETLRHLRSIEMTVDVFEDRRWRATITPIFNSERKVNYMLHQLEALTELTRAHPEAPEQLQFALESAKMGIWRIDLKTNIVTTSEGAAKIWGVDEINADVFEVVAKKMHPDDQARVNKAWTEAVANHTPYYAEYRILKPDGRMIWGFSKGETQFDHEGKPVALMGVLGDITDRKETELRLETARKQTELEAIRADRERAKFEAAFHAVAEGIFIFDSEGNPVFMNDGAAKVFGAKTAAEVTKGFAYYFERLDLYDMDDNFIPLSEWPVARVLRGESFRDWQIKAHRRDTDGRWIWSSSGELATQTGSDVSLAVVVLRDITDQIKAQRELVEAKAEAERATHLKSAFLANMSHEIRTPLGAILGFSSLLKDKNLDNEEKNEYIDTIIRNGNSLAKIIDDILDLAKVEAGKLEIEAVPFSLYRLASDAIDLFKDKTKEKNIYLLLNIDETVPTSICSDPTRLRQILVNLIGNAVKFTHNGGIRVNVRSELVEENKAKITFDVRDTGIGLEPEQKERLFKPFNQADNSMTRKFGGTGLGLALSQRLSKALSGEITISESKPGQGSTFTFVFYASIAKAINPADSLQEDDSAKSYSLKGLRILVVDDSPDNQFLVASLLTKNGALVETALDGQIAYDKAMSDSFDLILLDIQMPNMDGYQTKLALDRNGFIKPIIALTAHAMADERIKTAAAGFAGHLTKPLIASDLLRTVASFGENLPS